MPVLQKWHSSRFSAWIYLFYSLSVWNYEHQEQFACVSGICVRLKCLDWKVCVCVCKLGDVYPWTDTGNILSHLTCKSLCKWGPWVRVCQGGGHVSASCVCGGHTEREEGWVSMHALWRLRRGHTCRITVTLSAHTMSAVVHSVLATLCSRFFPRILIERLLGRTFLPTFLCYLFSF